MATRAGDVGSSPPSEGARVSLREDATVFGYAKNGGGVPANVFAFLEKIRSGSEREVHNSTLTLELGIGGDGAHKLWVEIDICAH